MAYDAADHVVSLMDPTGAVTTNIYDGCLLVASCEPCPLCFSAALWARMDRVIFAADRHDAADAGFDDRAFYEVFTSPPQEWPLTLEHVPGPDATLPFKQWTTRTERVEH